MKAMIRSAFLSIILLASYSCSFGVNILFDLGGVMFGTDKFKVALESGIISTTVFHMIQEMKQSQKIKPYSIAALWRALKNTASSEKTRERLFAFLELVEPRSEITPLAKDTDGKRLLPQIMCSWLMGDYTTKEIRKMIKRTAEENPEFFKSEQEKNRLVTICNRIIFHPRGFARTSKLFKDGLNFAQECKQKGHKLYVLSNWDKESFSIMQELYPELFTLFDDMLISGEAKTLKPDASIYTMALEKFGIDARNTVFIDDLADNVIAARKCGIASIHVHQKSSSPNFNNVKEEFTTWNRLHGFLSVA